MGIKRNRLVIIDGMPGSGKTTCATMISNKLTSWNIMNRCILELEENHPLFIHDHKFSSFEDDEQADLFIRLLESQYRDFVRERINSIHDVTIIESVMFQDTINCAHHMGMNHDKLRYLTRSLMSILEPLVPVLIYFYQVDVEGQWRFICGVRGNEWGPVSMHTDDDFKEAGMLWGGSQSFVRPIIDSWEIPKIIIENKDYHWDEYSNRIIQFIREHI
ncbi:P-loop NTPase family protein [Paenibacillus sp. CAU 1782]